MMVCLLSPMAWRTSRTQWVSDSSVTTTFGQIALSNSSLVTRRSGFSTRYRSNSKLFGRSATSRSAARRECRATSSVYPSNWNISGPSSDRPLQDGLAKKSQANLPALSPKLHGSVRTRASVYGNIASVAVACPAILSQEKQHETCCYTASSAFCCEDHRSEERRVGKEGRSRWSPYH